MRLFGHVRQHARLRRLAFRSWQCNVRLAEKCLRFHKTIEGFRHTPALAPPRTNASSPSLPRSGTAPPAHRTRPLPPCSSSTARFCRLNWATSTSAAPVLDGLTATGVWFMVQLGELTLFNGCQDGAAGAGLACPRLACLSSI
jgi:hypothetical protein